ncbi:MAG: DUF3047 domain-containing protein [Deltaproteobacteria bacterium]|nr:DUF3047 domain-containing protein [Deltaproteobacteria bacterium]
MILVVLSGPITLAESPSVIEVGPFSAEAATSPLPAHWEPLNFKKIERHTRYQLVEENGQVVVKATAEASASGLIRKIAIDPKEYPIVQWRWKAVNILKKGDVHKKEGDDYPARIYITFAYDADKLSFSDKVKYQVAKLFYGEYPPLASINYIWASNAPQGLVVPNPYTDRTMMVVIESGKEKLNTWVDEERNLYEDYKNAFKDEPPAISGVAVMTDTDNTGESATAYYGDIVFRKRPR